MELSFQTQQTTHFDNQIKWCSCCFCLCYLCRTFYKRNIKRLPCLHSLMQTLEGVWENSKGFV